MKRITQKIKAFALAHKIVSTAALAVVLGASYWGYKTYTNTSGETRYVLAAVEKGTIIASITGSGQVSASNQIELKPKASGDVVLVSAENGQDVRAGELIVQLDARDAVKAVRDAESNLQSVKISLAKLRQPADALSTLQTENALAEAKESKQNAEDNLKKSYDDGFTAVANAFIDLPAVMTGLQDILIGTTIAAGQWNLDYYGSAAANYDDRSLEYRDDARVKLQSARTAYDKSFHNYKSVSRSSDPPTIESLLDDTYATARAVSEAVKSANNLIQFYEDKLTERNLKPNAAADIHLASLNSYTGKVNTNLANLLSIKNSIQANRDAITSAERAIAEKTESLAKLKAGADPLDIQAQELAVKQRENALLDAREKLADYFVRAPFDGTIAKINVKKSDSVSASAAVATLITKQKLAEVSLNEVDAAKVKVGEKATLTFDAVDGLSISGKVAEIDAVGTVTQGVVTYSVKIGFDTQDDRVKSGMSVSAAIITDVRQDVLSVPNGAVKSQGGGYYVEVFDQAISGGQNSQGVTSPTPPREQSVGLGLANDTVTEITSGLEEGDQVVARTIPSSTATTQQAPSLFGTSGNRGSSGAIRIPR